MTASVPARLYDAMDFSDWRERRAIYRLRAERRSPLDSIIDSIPALRTTQCKARTVGVRSSEVSGRPSEQPGRRGVWGSGDSNMSVIQAVCSPN